ncbi:helix-turn-helix domain-containing protein [Paenibacillus sp. YN15]|uniref:helix-turn-helix domain-containing protein n=1 Tax=Paenibacillus sp. YN15 TaxID=1742774 RepID=UPI000DCCA3DB|nr:helix-turn-helix domain-containing protein [Paenibacillus sp. YN15]RAV01989.1 hypothetical protein DQG13_10715 [Paenibacillus sp. YN15]
MSNIAEMLRRASFVHAGGEAIQVPGFRHRECCMTSDKAGFLFVSRGSLRITLQTGAAQGTIETETGTVLFIPPSTGMMLQNEFQLAAEAVLVGVASACPEDLQMLESLHQPKAAAYALIARPFRMPQARQIFEEFLTESPPSDLAGHYRLQSHLYLMLSGFAHAANKPNATAMNLGSYVEHVRQFILKAADKPLDMEELAQSSGVSPSRFYRTFRQHTGMSPLQYSTQARIRAALRLMSNAPASVTAVAHAAGYEDELYFSRLFKKQMGLSPTEYITAANRKIAVVSPILNGDLSIFGIAPQITFERNALNRPEQVLDMLYSAKPDLIFAGGPLELALEQELGRIAPLHVLHWKTFSWKERLRRMGDTLGLRPVAEQWLERFRLKAENARSHIDTFWGGEPALAVICMDTHYTIFGADSRKISDLFYQELQLAVPECIRGTHGKKLLSLHEVAALPCENIIFLVPSGLEQLELARMEQNWRNLASEGRKKRCLFLPYYGALHYNAECYSSLVDQCVWRIRAKLSLC